MRSSRYCVLALIVCVFVAYAIPQQINYQGFLADPSGSALDTTLSITFALYDSPNPGAVLLWTETHSGASVSHGVFHVLLGSVTMLPDLFTANRWLGITVGGDAEMSPRQQIVSVAHAYRVGTVDGASGGMITGELVTDTLYADVLGFADETMQTTAWDSTSLSARIDAKADSADNATRTWVQSQGYTANAQTYPDTSTWDATKTWVKSMGYLRGANNLISATGFVGGGDNNKARGDYATIGGGGGASATDSNAANGPHSTIGGGWKNRALDDHATVGGGYLNSAGYFAATVAGGYMNNADTSYASVGGGFDNNATGYAATVGGGRYNRARGYCSVVAGGGSSSQADSNAALSSYSTVSGGRRNIASGTNATVSGGYENLADSTSATISGGWLNEATGYISTIGGGGHNAARGSFSVVGGGGGSAVTDSNCAEGDYATVGGGTGNLASQNATVGGGEGNLAYGFGSVIGGGSGNMVSSTYGVVGGGRDNASNGGATVSGGTENVAQNTYCTVGGGHLNLASDSSSTVSGGYGNEATGLNSTVGGGRDNSATGDYSTVSGGRGNVADITYATVCGGWNNYAYQMSFAAGRNARAIHGSSFVWGASNTGDTTTSFNAYTFTARCQNGARFYTASSGTGTGVSLAAGGGSWSNLCDARQKNVHGNVNTSDVLQKVLSLPLHRWSYKSQDEGIQHVGPTAQDFYATFGLGESDTTINTLDPDGVALAAIQELAKQNEKLRTELEAERTAVRRYREEMNELMARVQTLEADQQETSNRER